jgi:N-acetylglucosamine-6-phosphate deacetylase
VTIAAMPGERLADGVVLMKDGWIERTGAYGSFDIPAGTTIHDGTGCTVYAGFIDACVRIDSSAAARAASSERGAHWNARVVPQVRAADLPVMSTDSRKELRALGFTAAALHPNAGIFRGSAQVALLGDDPRAARTVVEDAGTCVAFETTGGGDDEASWNRATYPGALIGAIALQRQTFADAAWHAKSAAVWQAHPSGSEPPVLANALESLHAAANGKQRVWFDASDERNLLRADALAREMSIDASFVGSGLEFRRLAEVRATGRPVVVPFNFPKTPDTQSPRAIDAVSLRELEQWALAPTNLAELLRAGVPAAASTVRLKNVGEFAKAARRATKCGTTEDELLAALTTNPARMLGMSKIAGEVRAGHMANLVLCKGPLYGEDSKIREVWIAGLRHEVEPLSKFPLKGVYAMAAPSSPGGLTVFPESLTIDADERTVSFGLPKVANLNKEKDSNTANGKGAEVSSATPEPTGKGSESPKVRADGANFDDARVGFTMPSKELGADGTARGTIVATRDNAEVTLTAADGRVARWTIAAAARTGDVPDPKEERKNKRANAKGGTGGTGGDGGVGGADGKNGASPTSDDADFDPKPVLAAIPRVFPMGEYGVDTRLAPKSLLVEHATVWTVSDRGILTDADLLIKDGKIAAVGSNLRATLTGALTDTMIIDGTGMHVTPGMIDCHSHTGIAGGVNEWTQNVTAEVRIADAIDPEDINWYRQLAGGLTAANQLHGSSNPIGGQNSVVKIRWGQNSSAFPLQGAILGIKFALGENVVRGKNRYPGSRLGVEALIRDRFQSAREWRAAQLAYQALPDNVRAQTMPPQPDYELQTLAEILEGKRIVHCHSYRQDEIAMLIRVADDFKFQIGTFQHVLEGYKVADEIARHGAGASSFSDWWAYKMEVMDAIPWNGEMLWKAGVVTSFNSDSDELARHMNTEATKAVRYGGLTREEAIKFVTLNPAKQLRIDAMCGSLEPGKDADFVIWSADPLSVYARCMQTWVDGVRQFDVDTDRIMRARDAQTRTALIALATSEWGKGGGGDSGGGKGRPGKRGATPGMQDADTPPIDDANIDRDARSGGSLLARLRFNQRDRLMEMVRSGIDPAAIRPGECGCNQLDSWSAIFEVTGGEGGVR